jgi:hypothetical protein
MDTELFDHNIHVANRLLQIAEAEGRATGARIPVEGAAPAALFDPQAESDVHQRRARPRSRIEEQGQSSHEVRDPPVQARNPAEGAAPAAPFGLQRLLPRHRCG